MDECSVCGERKCKTEDFCNGCGAFVCESCEGDNPPMGEHDVEDHETEDADDCTG